MQGGLLIIRDGGYAADGQHMATEFMGRFLRERAVLPAVALTMDSDKSLRDK